MIRILLLALLISFCHSPFAQTEEPEYTSGVKVNSCKKFNFGVTSGINYTGLAAIQIEYIDQSKLGVDFNLGLGGWGYRMGANVKYYFNECGLGWALCGGISRSTGLDDFEIEMEVEQPQSPATTEMVTMNLFPVNTLNLFAARYWSLGARARFHLAFGISAKLTNTAYKVTSDHQLTALSKRVMNITTPGGGLLGIGFSF
jgi:hypothetical protein